MAKKRPRLKLRKLQISRRHGSRGQPRDQEAPHLAPRQWPHANPQQHRRGACSLRSQRRDGFGALVDVKEQSRSVGVRGRGDVVTPKKRHPHLIADSGYGYAIQVTLWGDIADNNTEPLQRQKAKATRRHSSCSMEGPSAIASRCGLRKSSLGQTRQNCQANLPTPGLRTIRQVDDKPYKIDFSLNCKSGRHLEYQAPNHQNRSGQSPLKLSGALMACLVVKNLLFSGVANPKP